MGLINLCLTSSTNYLINICVIFLGGTGNFTEMHNIYFLILFFSIRMLVQTCCELVANMYDGKC